MHARHTLFKGLVRRVDLQPYAVTTMSEYACMPVTDESFILSHIVGITSAPVMTTLCASFMTRKATFSYPGTTLHLVCNVGLVILVKLIGL